jgi:hypothetical protein
MSTARNSVVRGKAGAVAADPTQCPPGIDLSTFFFPLIPDEVRTLIPKLHSTSAEVLNKLLSTVNDYLCSSSSSFTISPEIYSNSELSAEDINSIMTALYLILRTALRNKVKVAVLKTDLAKMNVPSSVIEAIATRIKQSRSAYESRVIHHRNNFSRFEKVRWRVDVIISSGSLTRVMRPNILMQITTKDGRVTTFEISIDALNLLRYSAAKVLHEMSTLERHPILRIINEFKRREEEDYNH